MSTRGVRALSMSMSSGNVSCCHVVYNCTSYHEAPFAITYAAFPMKHMHAV